MTLLMNHPNWDPVIFHISGPVAVRWYGLAYLVGFVFAWFGLHWLQKSGYLRIRKKEVGGYLMAGAIGVVAGGRLGEMLFYHFDYLFLSDAAIGERLESVFLLWEGGMSIHGGIFGVAIAVFIYSRMRKQGFWNFADGCVLCVPVGIGLVRLANYINGELFGRAITDEAGKAVTDPEKLPWYAVKFPTDPAAVERMAGIDPALVSGPIMPVPQHVWDAVQMYVPGRYPTQLVQALLEGLVLFLSMWILKRWMQRPGMLSGMFLMLYALMRIPVELIRQPEANLDPEAGAQVLGSVALLDTLGLTMGQFLSVAVFLWGAAMLVLFWKTGMTGDAYAEEIRRRYPWTRMPDPRKKGAAAKPAAPGKK